MSSSSFWASTIAFTPRWIESAAASTGPPSDAELLPRRLDHLLLPARQNVQRLSFALQQRAPLPAARIFTVASVAFLASVVRSFSRSAIARLCSTHQIDDRLLGLREPLESAALPAPARIGPALPAASLASFFHRSTSSAFCCTATSSAFFCTSAMRPAPEVTRFGHILAESRSLPAPPPRAGSR